MPIDDRVEVFTLRLGRVVVKDAHGDAARIQLVRHTLHEPARLVDLVEPAMHFAIGASTIKRMPTRDADAFIGHGLAFWFTAVEPQRLVCHIAAPILMRCTRSFVQPPETFGFCVECSAFANWRIEHTVDGAAFGEDTLLPGLNDLMQEERHARFVVLLIRFSIWIVIVSGAPLLHVVAALAGPLRPAIALAIGLLAQREATSFDAERTEHRGGILVAQRQYAHDMPHNLRRLRLKLRCDRSVAHPLKNSP